MTLLDLGGLGESFKAVVVLGVVMFGKFLQAFCWGSDFLSFNVSFVHSSNCCLTEREFAMAMVCECRALQGCHMKVDVMFNLSQLQELQRR